MERFDLTSPGFKGNLIAKFAGSRFGICGVVPAIRLGEAIRLMATHARPEARFLLLVITVNDLLADPSDRGVHEVVDQVWELIAADNWLGTEVHFDLEGAICGFSQAEVEAGDWDDEAFAAVMVPDVAGRADAIEALLNDVLETYVAFSAGGATSANNRETFAAVRSNVRLAQVISTAVSSKNPCCSYLVITSLLTDVAHQCDADGIDLAVQCAMKIYAQPAWPQAQVVRDERSWITGFTDSVYDGQGLAKAAAQAVLQQEVADRERAVWGLIYFAVEDPLHDWGHEIASFLEKQRFQVGGRSCA